MLMADSDIIIAWYGNGSMNVTLVLDSVNFHDEICAIWPGGFLRRKLCVSQVTISSWKDRKCPQVREGERER